jgi:hypothetical protein
LNNVHKSFAGGAHRRFLAPGAPGAPSSSSATDTRLDGHQT